ncbi:MAG: hypothetical protein SGJ00_12360 [bacterium]|nr:hypothetical protein [bacterium]
MKKTIIWVLTLCLFSTLLFSSCKKNKELDTDITSAEDQSEGELVYDQIFKQVDQAAGDEGLKKGAYPIITKDTFANPKTMRINYGTSNYLCLDGNYRRGLILVSWTGRYRDAGTAIQVGFDGFYQNNNLVEGTKSITNNGPNALGELSYTIVVNGKITNPSLQSHSWNSNRTRTWVAGQNTLTALDDVYEITGTTSGTNRNGINYAAQITTKLRVELACDWRIVSGVIEVTPEGKNLRKIDFGNGACNGLVTVSVNGRTKTFSRKK